MRERPTPPHEQINDPKIPGLDQIDAQEAERILQRVEIHGKEVNGERLTPDFLLKEGLAPKYRVRVGDEVIWFASDPYDLEDGDGRLGIIGYVEHEGNVVARSYYRSNSQGNWRYLPQAREVGGKPVWYSKGYDEESIGLPFAAQEALSRIPFREGGAMRVSNPNLVFLGTTKKAYGEATSSKVITYNVEVNKYPKVLKGNFYPTEHHEKIPPEQLVFSTPEQAPDFSRLLASWESDTSLYGKVTNEVFASRDDTLRFMFSRDASGRAWIASIENKSPVGSTGLHTEWVNGGDLTTPPYEYDTYAKGFGNAAKRKGYYVDMFDNYLSKVPVIKEYLASVTDHEGNPAKVQVPTPQIHVRGVDGRVFGGKNAGVWRIEEAPKDIFKIQKEKIGAAESFTELFAVLDILGGLWKMQPDGSVKQEYTAADMKRTIEAARSDAMYIISVTRLGELRSKVEELLKKEEK